MDPTLHTQRSSHVWSARTMRQRVAFSMAYFVFPIYASHIRTCTTCPAMRPMARLMWSPCSRRTSFISNVSGPHKDTQHVPM